MKNKSDLLKIIEIVLHVLGFPVLLAVAFILNIKVIKYGAQYGISAFVFAIVIVLFAIIYYVAYFLLIKQEKKRRQERLNKKKSDANENIEFVRMSKADASSKADPARRTGIVLAIVAVCCLSGFWAFFDLAVPDLLADKGTSRTIFYEDLADGWNDRADVNQELLDEYITRCYYSGKLTENTLDVYLKQGIKNKEVAALLDADFASIDSNGYATFIGPSVDFAQNGRMTINAIIHLLLDDRTPVTDEKGQRKDEKILVTTYKVDKINQAQLNQTSNANKIQEGQTYSYYRSKQAYYLYNGTLDVAGTKIDGMIIYDEYDGYRCVQYLAGNPKKYNSYIYTQKEVNGGLTYTEQVFSGDHLIRETVIVQSSSGEVTATVKYKSGGEMKTIERSLGNAIAKNGSVYSLIIPDNLGFEDVDAQTAFSESSSSATKILSSDKETVYAQEDDKLAPESWSFSDCIILLKTKDAQYATWDIFDMLGTDTTFELPIQSIRDLTIPLGGLTGAKLLDDYKYAIDDVLGSVGDLLSDPNVVGSSVTVSLDTETGVLAISPCNEERGTLDYMRQAWLKNNGLIYIIVSLFSLRKIFLIYAGILAVISYLIGMVREGAYGGENGEDEKKEPSDGTPDDGETDDEVSEEQKEALGNLDA